MMWTRLKLTQFVAVFGLMAGLAAGGFFLARAVGGDGGSTAAQQAGPQTPQDVRGPLPDFRNKVIHYQSLSFHERPGVVDKANGELLIADVWVRLDASNSPVASRRMVRFEDGSFYHGELASVKVGRVISAFDQPIGTPEHPLCTSGSIDPGTLSIVLQGALPMYLGLEKGEKAGLRPLARPVETPPALQSFDTPAVAPERVVNALDNLIWLAGDIPAGLNTTHEEDEVDAQSGLVRVHTLETRSPDGVLVDKIWARFTAIEVYGDSPVLDSIFDESSLPNEC